MVCNWTCSISEVCLCYLFVCCRNLTSGESGLILSIGSCSRRLFHNFAISNWMTSYNQPLIIVQLYVPLRYFGFVLCTNIPDWKKKNPTHLKPSWDFVCDLEQSSLSSENYTLAVHTKVTSWGHGLPRFPWALGGKSFLQGPGGVILFGSEHRPMLSIDNAVITVSGSEVWSCL